MPNTQQKILIANRGEIAVRIIRACRTMGLPNVVVFSEADRYSLPALMADEAICIGRAPAHESYLKMDRIIAAAELCGATAIHPGYGFLAENAHFAEICKECGLVFIGPSPEAIKAMGDKNAARNAMKKAGIPVVPGSDGEINSLEEAEECALKLGYPVIFKAVNGGGGRGMRIAQNDDELKAAFETATSEAQHSFNAPALYLEKYQIHPRHVEVQLLADNFGHIVHLGDRDCSMQRRHQKVIEESPCPALSRTLRNNILETALKAAASVNYSGVGTIEFLVSGEVFHFMEMNTRLQVEHPVTEATTGIDLVQEQIRVALNQPLSMKQSDCHVAGHAIEMRINAEDPDRGFAPCPGKIDFFLPPGGPGIRVDSHVFSGYSVPPFYDNLLAKIIAFGPDRKTALTRADIALRELTIRGIPTNIAFLRHIINSNAFISGDYHTGTLEEIS